MRFIFCWLSCSCICVVCVFIVWKSENDISMSASALSCILLERKVLGISNYHVLPFLYRVTKLSILFIYFIYFTVHVTIQRLTNINTYIHTHTYIQTSRIATSASNTGYHTYFNYDDIKTSTKIPNPDKPLEM